MAKENNWKMILHFRDALLSGLTAGTIVINCKDKDLDWVDRTVWGNRKFEITLDQSTDITPQYTALLANFMLFHNYIERAAREYKTPDGHDFTLTSNQIAALLTYSREWVDSCMMGLDNGIDAFSKSLAVELKTLETLKCIKSLTIYERIVTDGETIQKPHFEIILNKEQAACLMSVVEEARHQRIANKQLAEKGLELDFDGDQKLMSFFISDQTASQRR